MKSLIVCAILFCVLLSTRQVNSETSSRRLQIIETQLSRTSSSKLLSSSGGSSNLDLTTPFVIPKILQSGVNQTDVIFDKWKSFYTLNYKAQNDEIKAKGVFAKRLNDVVEHNAKYAEGLETYWKTLNGYSGLEFDDLVILRTGLDTVRMAKVVKKLRNLRKLKKTNLERRTWTWTTTTAATATNTTTQPTTTTTNPTNSTTTTTNPTNSTTTTTNPTTSTTTTTRPTTTTTTTTRATTTTAVTATVDHTTSPYYPIVKDQGMCGSCWAFASLVPVEFQLNKLYGVNTYNLAEQQLVNCDTYNSGCNGGLPDYFYYNMIGTGNGVVSESLYQYTGTDGTCKTQFRAENFKITSQVENTSGASNGWGTGTEAQIETLVRNGPVVVAMYASDPLFSYAGGIYKGCGTATYTPNHAVTIVGFGVESGVPYWLVRNSWGTNWGINGGHFKMQKGVNMCNVKIYYTQPVVTKV